MILDITTLLVNLVVLAGAVRWRRQWPAAYATRGRRRLFVALLMFGAGVNLHLAVVIALHLLDA